MSPSKAYRFVIGSLAVLAYNLTRIMNIIGAKRLIAAIRGLRRPRHLTLRTELS